MLKNVGQARDIYQSRLPQRNKISFGDNPVPAHSKDYYNYVGSETNTKKKLLIAGLSFVGLSVAFSIGFKKAFNKIFSKKIAIAEGTALASITTLFGLKLTVKSKKLAPIPESEQKIKEQQIKDLVQDMAKKKNVKISGFCFYDYSKYKNKKHILASFDVQTGYISITSQFKDTNLDINEAKPLLVHELTHAKQYENIARSKDGIYNLNKIFIMNELKTKDEKTKTQIMNTPYNKLYELAKSNIKNNPKEFTIVNEQLDTENEAKKLKAIKMYLENPNISKYHLPLAFNEKYYAEIARKGPLSSEDEQKVKAYLDYMSKDSYADSKNGTIGKSIKTTFIYMMDPIEKEAYAAQHKYMKTGEI